MGYVEARDDMFDKSTWPDTLDLYLVSSFINNADPSLARTQAWDAFCRLFTVKNEEKLLDVLETFK